MEKRDVSKLAVEVLAEPVLVGRERELKQLRLLLNSALEGEGKTVFVSGEAGSGKTRLTKEFLNSAQNNQDLTLLFGWCHNNATVPYFPFIQAFKAYLSAVDNKDVQKDELEINAWLLGLKQAENSGKYGNLSPQAWKDLTFEAISKVLFSISAKKPTVLFVEDLHWADSASLSLLHYIARTMSSERILVIATFRSEELNADAEGHQHPLAETLRLMKREDLCTEIKLHNLDQNSVSKIAENLMGGDVQTDFAFKLAEESRGNPLFVVESLRMLSERGSLYKENNQWQLSIDALEIPDKFKDIILNRLSRLKFDQRRVLDAAAVIGEKFDVDLLAVVLGQDCLAVLEALNMVAQSTSLVCVEHGFFRFDHAKSREVIYEEIPLPLRKGYHARVAERLESISKKGQAPLSDIAFHYAQTDNREKAAKFSLAAGLDALARFSNLEAIKHFGYVLQNATNSPENAERNSTALEALGDAYYASRMSKEALEVFERLASSETGKVRLRAFRKAMDTTYFGTFDPAHLIELAKKAEPYAASDRLENARIRFHRGGILSYEQRAAEFEAALRVFEEEYSLPDVARALSAIGSAKTVINPSKTALSGMLRSIALFEELSDLPGLLTPTFTVAFGFFLLGFFQESEIMCSKALCIGERIGNYGNMARSSAVLGKVLERLGRYEEALSTSLKAIEYNKKASSGSARFDVLGQIYAGCIRQYTKLGDLRLAEEYFSKLVNLPAETGFHPSKDAHLDLLHLGEILRAKAIFFSARNQLKEAKQCFSEAFEIAKKLNAHSFSTALMTDYAWFLDDQERIEEARTQLEETQKITERIEKEFGQVEVEANFMAPRNVLASEEFEMSLMLVNVSRKPGLLAKAEELVPSEFELISTRNSPTAYTAENGSVNLNEEKIGPFEVKTIKLKTKAPKPGSFNLNPRVTYIDESGEKQNSNSNTVTITVKPAKPKFETLPGRVTTGFEDLDALLFGGIPEKYTVALVAPSDEERKQLVLRFLSAGAKSNEPTFFVTVEPSSAKSLADRYASFFLFVCNPKADTLVPNLPNVFRLKGVENLTNLDIELVRAFRALKSSGFGTRRICLEIVSDVLLQHHAVDTRRWLSALLPTLKNEGFTVLAVVDSQLHPTEELLAVLGLFDGEIRVTERESGKDAEKTLRIRKLYNQKYLDNELVLKRQSLQQQ